MNSLAQLPSELLSQQIQNGLVLMGLGMGVVFAFLTILVFSTKLISKLLAGTNAKKAAPVQSAPAAVKQQAAAPVQQKAAKQPVAAAPAASVSTAQASGDVKAPMPGTVLRMNVKVGDTVQANQMLLVMEAMKMENEIYAPKAGKVEKICVQNGQQLNADDLILVISGNSPSSIAYQATTSAPVAVPKAKPASTPKTGTPKEDAGAAVAPKPFTVPARTSSSAPIRVASKGGAKPAPRRPLPNRPAAPVAQTNTPAAAAGGAVVKAPMAGTVLRLNVKEGDTVQKNQQIMVLEAMKMENEIFAPAAGKIVKIFVQPGASLEADAPMIEIG